MTRDSRRMSLTTLIAANQAFYDAHEARTLDAMDRIWLHDDRVVCVHPGWPILRGWDAVRTSWMQIFQGPGRNQFILTGVDARVTGDIGWVTLEENLLDRAETHTIAATNIFERIDDKWCLVCHHGSPVMVS